jgi:hypothetical protein
MKIKDLVQLLSTLDSNNDIRSYEKWDNDEEACVLDVVDVRIEKQLKTGITHCYLVLGNEEISQPATVAIPPRPYRASD